LRPTGSGRIGADEVLAAARAELLPVEKNYLRHGDRVRPALAALDAVWAEAAAGLRATGAERVRARQAAAITAVGRLMYRSALARTESRGMSKRADHPGLDPAQHHHILSGGLDEVWTVAAALRSADVSAVAAVA
jgi:succinate dehydrogenase/fumarate reductase flavoprotein subunit